MIAPQFTPIESAVCACLIDGMTYRQASAAIGCAVSRVFRVACALHERFHLTKREDLVYELEEIAGSWRLARTPAQEAQ